MKRIIFSSKLYVIDGKVR